MSCQPHRITSGQSNSGAYLKNNLIFINLSVKSVHKTNHLAKIKQNIHTQPSDTNSEGLVLSILPLLKEHTRLGHAGIVEHSV